MRLNKIRGRGWLPFPGEFNIDLDSLNGTIVAVTGPNGAGKSSFLELFPGCLFRKLPTRGTLKDFAASRDSFIECEVVNGNQYRIRQTVDGVSGKAETSLTDADGKAILTSGKVSEFTKWADKNLPQQSVFYSSLFAAQGSKGLLGMDPAERKAVILRVLGLERLEALAQLARQNRSDVDKELAGVRARADEIGTADISALQAAVSSTKTGVDGWVELAEGNEKALATAREEAAAVERQRSEYNALVTRRTELESQARKLRERIVDLDVRLANNRAVVAEAITIREAVARDAEISNLISSMKTEESALRVSSAELEGRYNALRQEERTHSDKRTAIQRSIANADLVIAVKPSVVAAVKELSTFEAQLKVVEAGLTAADEEVARLQAEALTGKDSRITTLRGDLRYIAEGSDEGSAASYADGAIENDDKAELGQKTLPERTATAASRRNALYNEQREVQRSLRQSQNLAARLPEIEGAEKTKAQALGEIEGLDAVSFVEVRAELDRSTDEVSNALSHTRSQLQKLGNEQASLGPLIKKAEALGNAETRIETLLHERSGLEKELEEIEHKRDGIQPIEPPPSIDLSAYETAVTRARATVQDYQTKLALTEKELANAKDKETRRAVLVEKARALEETVADWTRLSQDLGRDGLQALEIDCAGPEITTLANDLLRSCGDTRFTVSVETTRMDSTGKRELEGCEIIVMDSKNGQTKTAEQLSGGEAVFVGEAISLSLAMLGCRRSGVSSPTIVRDESGAALDPERGPMYVAMLRRAAEIVGASKILFVSHSPDLQALADSTIRILNGEVSIV